jgi:hypothetical protein
MAFETIMPNSCRQMSPHDYGFVYACCPLFLQTDSWGRPRRGVSDGGHMRPRETSQPCEDQPITLAIQVVKPTWLPLSSVGSQPTGSRTSRGEQQQAKRRRRFAQYCCTSQPPPPLLHCTIHLPSSPLRRHLPFPFGFRWRPRLLSVFPQLPLLYHTPTSTPSALVHRINS